MAEQFADISSHQQNPGAGTFVNLNQHRTAGFGRILFKTSESVGYVNPYFRDWWALAGALGFSRGAYHFARPSRGNNGAQEAKHFNDQLLGQGFRRDRDWVCLDVEDTDAGGIARAAAHAVEFCERMVLLGYPNGVVYSGKWYLDPAHLTSAVLPEGWRQLHIAIYNAAPDASVPMPTGWARGTVVARQFTSSASQTGIPGDSDANRVVAEWLGTSPIGESPMSVQEVRDALNEGTAMGFTSWAQMVKDSGGIVDLLRKAFDAVKPGGTLPAQVGLVGTNVSNAVAAANTARDQATQARTAAEAAQLAAEAALSAILSIPPTGPTIDYEAFARAFLTVLPEFTGDAVNSAATMGFSRLPAGDTHDYNEEQAAARRRGEPTEGHA